ncbi:MAG: PH domain-containing protein [Lachnospiraceae bacterium]|nr:PH domain-containing protein [Lachnospiraceae bacterium]
MIDFQNGSFVKMSKTNPDVVMKQIQPLLLDDENVIGVYKAIRDYCVFTNKRVISVNVQGVTGKKKDFTSMPYSKVAAFSVETSGVLDLDSELEMYFSGLGKVKFEFSGSSDIIEIGRTIGTYIL